MLICECRLLFVLNVSLFKVSLFYKFHLYTFSMGYIESSVTIIRNFHITIKKVKVHGVLKDLVHKLINETSELKQYPSLRAEGMNAAAESLDKMRNESKRATIQLVDTECSYFTIESLDKMTTLSDIHLYQDGNSSLSLHVNLEKNSSSAAYDYFCDKLSEIRRDNLMKISVTNLVARGSAYLASQQSLATKLLEKAFKVRLGRGLYGECLGVRIDGNSNLSDIIGKELNMKSEAAGLWYFQLTILIKLKFLS
ncbi:hypothetical protein HanPI659440_Chr10g0369861 [Helianthus annuus]|nr:hypothetical protein HanPI659440_Chr10g0369861 [Helianthus annuus]